MLSKETILNAVDIMQETVQVPEWGGEVIVRSLTGTERDKFEQSLVDQRKAGKKFFNIRATLCALSIVDEKGDLLFTETDIDALGKKSAAPLDRITEVVRRLSGFLPEDIEAAEKNS